VEKDFATCGQAVEGIGDGSSAICPAILPALQKRPAPLREAKQCICGLRVNLSLVDNVNLFVLPIVQPDRLQLMPCFPFQKTDNKVFRRNPLFLCLRK
jgi:hypothetical protein